MPPYAYVPPIPTTADLRGLILSPSSLERAVSHSGQCSGLARMQARLRNGKALTVTAIGMSTTFDFAGCFGDGCNNSTRADHGIANGWGHLFMQQVNSSFPNPAHSFHNRAAGASSPALATMCLTSHVAPHTDILIVDFALSNWSLERQELLVRAAAQLPRAVLVIILGLVDWCPEIAPPSKAMLHEAKVQAQGGKPWNELEWRKKWRLGQCIEGFKRGVARDSDPTGRISARVAAHYNDTTTFVDVHSALRPLLTGARLPSPPPDGGRHGGGGPPSAAAAASTSGFADASTWTIDGLHPWFNFQRHAHPYNHAIAQLLAHRLLADDQPSTTPLSSPREAAAAPRHDDTQASSTGTTTTTSHPGAADDGASRGPATMPSGGDKSMQPPPPLTENMTSVPRAFACYSWLNRNFKSPRVRDAPPPLPPSAHVHVHPVCLPGPLDGDDLLHFLAL